MRILRPLAAVLGLTLLSGCAFSTGFREGSAAGLPPEAPVIVALTEAKLVSELDAHTVFWSRSRDVVRSLADRPGLVGYSIRLEPLGTRVWTMTVWRDEASLMAFVQSATHARAVRDGLPTMADGRFAQVRVTRAEAPLAWPDAVERLARDGRGYYE
jgi:heme-degrading monooxygenase HmoA